MTDEEKTMLFFDDFLKGIGLDYMVFASTLLGIIRGGELLPGDKEIDFCVHGADLTDEMMGRLQASGHYGVMYPCHEKYGEFYLSDMKSIAPSEPHVAMNPLWKKNGVVYQNIHNDECMLWDPKYYPKETWSTIKYLGREFKAPSNPKAWLKYWYGSDWKTPLSGTWHDNKNLRLYKDLWV